MWWMSPDLFWQKTVSVKVKQCSEMAGEQWCVICVSPDNVKGAEQTPVIQDVDWRGDGLGADWRITEEHFRGDELILSEECDDRKSIIEEEKWPPPLHGKVQLGVLARWNPWILSLHLWWSDHWSTLVVSLTFHLASLHCLRFGTLGVCFCVVCERNYWDWRELEQQGCWQTSSCPLCLWLAVPSLPVICVPSVEVGSRKLLRNCICM